MIVCVCKRVTESQIIGEIRRGACELRDLSERLGVATQCGCCRECACELLDTHANGGCHLRGRPASIAA